MSSFLKIFAISLALLPYASSTSFLPFLNFTSPSPHIFHSVVTLLQTWPQNVFPNGHTIASVTIPRHTLLYHGRHDNDAVPSPEWLAFDNEMAYGIMGNMQDSRLLTYRTTRDVKAVYFDGASANLMGEGTMGQMVLLYNGSDNVPRRGGPGRGPPPGRGHKDRGDGPRPPGEGRWNPLEDEYFRARELCKWLRNHGLGGTGWGYEGIVRMNAGFELIWCDFESPSLKMVSNLNVSAPLLDMPDSASLGQYPGAMSGQGQAQRRIGMQDEGPHGPGMTDPREPFRDASNWFWFLAAAKRYHGESRIKLDACGIVSFYDSRLQNQSSARIQTDQLTLNLTSDGKWEASSDKEHRDAGLQKLMKRRRQHTLNHVGKHDARLIHAELEQSLKRNLMDRACDDVDWSYIAREIMTWYDRGLQDVQQQLRVDIKRTGGGQQELREWLQLTRALTHWFLLPFIEYPSNRPYDLEDLKDMFSLESDLAKKTLERCQSQYDLEASSSKGPHNVLYSALQETLAGICSTVVAVGLGIEYYWLLHFNSQPAQPSEAITQDHDVLLTDVHRWMHQVEELMAWLGWVEQWRTCNPACSIGHTCYIPMWPTGGMMPPRRRPGDGGHGRGPPHVSWEWIESKYLWDPVCVNASSYPPEEWD